MSALPATNAKSLPNHILLCARASGGITPETNIIIEYSSGGTVISPGILANIPGIETVEAYLSNKTFPAKLDLLRLFGLDMCAPHLPFQANSLIDDNRDSAHRQPEPLGPNGGVYAAAKDGQGAGGYNPDQHSKPNMSYFSRSLGQVAGTVARCGSTLQKNKPDITPVGV
ncbi:hypothetical protein OPQ81_011907 [Rhizoctonia solani]|nr:hypothetical protein OPQ81_011907 [Rhizoctonia solani]